ncbi:DHS-like NAD/FAD-binding domain-containing protein [Aspergillus cavernicola]|uniref:DHS-like NAD/FAD-binding domain-containing protein n=1 Tax=Aspergillus cavernicola TaxID=176166 RepID=A0ABR4I560_9EURO
MVSSDVRTFSEHLKGSKRIMALLGAGISAASGLPTFRGAGGLWRSYDATELATPEAFEANPDLVWQFYSYRRHMALNAKPNPAHYALAELAKRNKEFITLTQNVDGLSQRANHPLDQLHLLHGNLFTVKCTSFYCNYFRENDFTDPIVPALAIPKNLPEPPPYSDDKTAEEASESLQNAMGTGEQTELDISDERIPLAPLERELLPHCPECKEGLLRPGVVWFGEALPSHTLDFVDDWMKEGRIDLMLVIGTSSRVMPAAGYTEMARSKGARIAVVNMDGKDTGPGKLTSQDWSFQGDAGVLVPEILKSVIGEI